MKKGLLGGSLRGATKVLPRGGPVPMLHAGLDLSRSRERLHSTLGYRSPEKYEQDYYERGDCERQEETIFIEEERKAA